jgi:hypothetical protein
MWENNDSSNTYGQDLAPQSRSRIIEATMYGPGRQSTRKETVGKSSLDRSARYLAKRTPFSLALSRLITLQIMEFYTVSDIIVNGMRQITLARMRHIQNLVNRQAGLDIQVWGF